MWRCLFVKYQNIRARYVFLGAEAWANFFILKTEWPFSFVYNFTRPETSSDLDKVFRTNVWNFVCLWDMQNSLQPAGAGKKYCFRRAAVKRRKNRQLVPNFVRTQISKFSFMLAQELGKFACYPKMGETVLFKNVFEACAREECILSLLF